MSGRLILTLTGGEGPPAELPRAGVLVIGSDPDRAGFLVEGQGVSEAHCAIGRAKGGGWALKDLGSEYGTRVNGKPVSQARLAPGDEILIGSRRIRVQDPEQSEASSAPATSTPASPSSSAGRARASTPARSAAAGSDAAGGTVRIPGFRIERLLGRGGMGQVYLAVQESLDRRVALKILAPKLAADADFVAQFQREARAAAALNHPNVVTVHDVGESSGLHYLAMEYMAGGSQESRLSGRGPLPWEDVVAILKDAAEGLVYAEARGIVHRDIKPDNLMVNEVGATKIADLGLASHALEDQGDKKIVGTPHFMAPEQVRGEDLDARTDIYGLGATAYRLLSGHTIFEGDSTRDILRSVLRDDPPPLTEEVPEGVRALVERAIAKDPADRFPSAKILLRELERLQRTGGALGGDEAPAATGSKRPLALLGAAVVLLAAGWALFGGGSGDTTGGENGGPAGTQSGGNGGGGVATGGNGGNGGFDPDPEFGASGNAGGGNEAPVDSDAALKAREKEAQIAYLELKVREGLVDEERRDLLLALAERFPGTTFAGTARTEAGELEARLLAAERAATERALRIGATVDALREASQPDRTPPRPGEALTAMERVAGQTELATDAEFLAARRELVQGVVDRGLEYASKSFEEIADLGAKGEFTAVRARLQSLVAALELPEETPLLDGVNRVERLREQRREAERQLGRLDERRDEYRIRRAERERTLLVEGLTANGGIEAELRGLELGAALARLEALAAEVQTADGAREFVAGLIEDVRRGRAALELIHSEWSSWRRKTVIDPRASRKSQAVAVAVDAEGLSIEEGGGVERVPWSAFGDRPDAVHQLFQGRLERDYTSEEEGGIAGLLRVTAVMQALLQADEMFQAQRDARFTDGEAQDLREVFTDVLEWAAGTDVQARNRREKEASRLLADVLHQASDGAFTSAAAGVERLLDGFSDTLLVRLLSDGSEWRVRPPSEPEPDEDDAAAPANGSSGGDEEG